MANKINKKPKFIIRWEKAQIHEKNIILIDYVVGNKLYANISFWKCIKDIAENYDFNKKTIISQIELNLEAIELTSM